MVVGTQQVMLKNAGIFLNNELRARLKKVPSEKTNAEPFEQEDTILI